jgi:peptidyl-prolyl cis-trans isomerase D
MGLLENIRQQTDSPWAKVIFGAVVIVFVFWGVGASGGPKSTSIAEVNGERITDTQLQRIMRDVSNRATGSMNEEDLNQITNDVISQLIMKEVLLQEAARVGIEVSDQEIGRYVLEFDAFRTESGNFEVELYERNLKRMGLSRGKFEEQIRHEFSIQKLEALIRSAVLVSDEELTRIYVSSATEVSVDYVRIADASLLQYVDVAQESIDAYVASSETELKATYEDDFDRLYNTPPRVTYRQLQLRTNIEGFEADAVQQKLTEVLEQARADGTEGGFSTLAARYSEDFSASNGGAMGTQARQQIAEEAQQPLLEASPGTITDIIETAQGLSIYYVSEVFPAETLAFDDVKQQIARDALASQTLTEFSDELAQKVLAAWQSGGQPPAELMTEYGLSLETAGPFPKGNPMLGTASSNVDLMRDLSRATGPGVLGSVYSTDSGRLVAAVTSYTEADMTMFELQKEIIRAQLTEQKQEVALMVWRQDLRNRARVVQHYNP